MYIAHEKASGLSAAFAEGYEGDATEEVGMFLANLPTHIYRLILFYTKMGDYIVMTSQSFMENDNKMTEKMGGKSNGSH